MKIGFNWLVLLICVCQQAHGMQQYLLTGNEHKKLAQAIQKDDLAFIKELFAQERLHNSSWIGENRLVGWGNAREHNRPILHTAVKYGSIKIVQLLLEHGFEINYRYVPDSSRRCNRHREYNLPLYYADEAPLSKRKPLIHLLVLHGAQLFEEEQNFNQVRSWLHKPACLKTFLQAPRVTPEAPQGTMWQETKERLVALACSLKRFKTMHNITVPKDMRRLLCQYVLMADGPLTERFLLSELCYLAQKNLVDKKYLIEKLVEACECVARYIEHKGFI